jgi:hypothetical protein
MPDAGAQEGEYQHASISLTAASRVVTQDANLPRGTAKALNRLWFCAGLAFVVAAFALLELLDPYFFCQDDALSLELPGVLMTCRGIWQGLVA